MERLIYRLTGVDEAREMRWTEYAVAMLLFSAVSMLVLYLMQRVQQWLPWNPQAFGAVPPDQAFNTAASFTTNTNWQSYSGESTMTYLTQMAGLAYHNFVSAATGIALAIAFIRGIAQRRRTRSVTSGSIWSAACCGCSCRPAWSDRSCWCRRGWCRTCGPYDKVAILDPQTTTAPGADGKPQTQVVTEQVIAQGPVASQEVIKEFGTNGGGFFNATARIHSKTDAVHELLRDGLHLCHLGGPDVHARRHDRLAQARVAVWGAMAFLFLAGVTTAYWAEARGTRS